MSVIILTEMYIWCSVLAVLVLSSKPIQGQDNTNKVFYKNLYVSYMFCLYYILYIVFLNMLVLCCFRYCTVLPWLHHIVSPICSEPPRRRRDGPNCNPYIYGNERHILQKRYNMDKVTYKEAHIVIYGVLKKWTSHPGVQRTEEVWHITYLKLTHLQLT